MKTKNLKGKPSLEQFRREYPEKYVELAEKIGYKEFALGYYSKSGDPTKLFHAAEIAYSLGRYRFVKNILEKVITFSEKELQRARQISNEDTLGDSYTREYYQTRSNEIRQKVSQMEARLL